MPRSGHIGPGIGGIGAIAVILLAAWLELHKDVLALFGRVDIDPAKLVRWENSTALNNGACEVIRVADACEDVKIHFNSSTAFVACGDPVGRTHWYPPACVRNARARSEGSFREKLFKHEIKTGKTTELKVEGLDGDFVTHGIDLSPVPGDPSKIHIFAVRHVRDGDSISIFSHRLGSDVVELVKDVKHPSIKTANGVAAVGAYQFYFTNDHYFANDPLRWLEERLGPWSWASHVQYCDVSHEVDCRQVTEAQPGANGLAVWEDKMFVGDSKNATLTIYTINPDHGVKADLQVELGAAADNINIDPSTGDLIVSIFPTLEDLPHYLANVDKLGKDLLVPAAALRLPKKKHYQPELVYFDEGGVVSDMTAMAIDPYNKVLVGAAVLQYGGFAVCRIGDDH